MTPNLSNFFLIPIVKFRQIYIFLLKAYQSDQRFDFYDVLLTEIMAHLLDYYYFQTHIFHTHV